MKKKSDQKTMRYQCPRCGCMKKPKIVQYYPPIIVECIECKKKGSEKEFIKEDQARAAPIHYIS